MGGLGLASGISSGIFRRRLGIFHFQLEFSVGAGAFVDVIHRPPTEKSRLRFHGTVTVCT
jgi:hypothetical protein